MAKAPTGAALVGMVVEGIPKTFHHWENALDRHQTLLLLIALKMHEAQYGELPEKLDALGDEAVAWSGLGYRRLDPHQFELDAAPWEQPEDRRAFSTQ